MLENYNNNPLLKKVGSKLNFTQYEIDELIKCKEDPIYFIKNYCKIISLDSEEPISFDLFGYQEKFINLVHDNRRVISMQPRQMGKTQTVAAYICWYITFQQNQTVAILANKADQSREILSRCKIMYEYLPSWMQHGIKKWNEGSIHLENGSKAFSAATTKSGLRGRSCNFLYIDEAAAIPNNIADDFFTAIYPIISSGKNTKIVITSTPIGYNHFWKYWNDAEKGINGFVPLKVTYQEHPHRDDKWAKEQLQLLGKVKYNQEVLCEFLGSSFTLISGDVLSRLSSKEYVWQKNDFDAIEEPIPGHSYFMCVDTSEGIGGDSSTFVIVDITKFPYMTAGKFKCNTLSYLLFPDVIYTYAKKYNNALVLVEINNIGMEVARILHDDLEYENLLLVSQETKTGQFLSLSSRANYGVKTTKQVKRIGCQTLKSLIEENQLLVQDEDIIKELSTFIERKDSFAADEGYHDDLVMPLVLFAWATKDNMFKSITNVDTRKAIMKSKMLEIASDVMPAGYYNTDPVTVDYEMSDKSWLFKDTFL